MLETVAQAVINGLLIGGIYALVSIGVTLIFGVVKIVNFAQGEFVMIGMYISFYLASQFGIDPILSLFVSMPVLFVIGVLVQHFLIRRVLGQSDMPQIFLTFALSLLLLNLALMLFTANYRTVHTSYSDEAFHLGGLYIPVAKLIAFVLAMVLSGVLWVFLHTTDLGKAMRAAAQNRDVAMLMGINPDRVFCVALGIALALAGAAGSLLMPVYSAYPFVGQVFVLMAFVAVVLGTLGNVIGALIASLMMGVAESLGIQFVGADSGLIVVFAMDRHDRRRHCRSAGQPSDRLAVLPLARSLFHHRHHRDGPGVDADISQISRSRLGRRGHHHPEPRQCAADDAVRDQGG